MGSRLLQGVGKAGRRFGGGSQEEWGKRGALRVVPG